MYLQVHIVDISKDSVVGALVVGVVNQPLEIGIGLSHVLLIPGKAHGIMKGLG